MARTGAVGKGTIGKGAIGKGTVGKGAMVPSYDETYHWPDLTADCDQCVGLCCIAYPFIDLDKFAYEKPSDTPCRHLGPQGGCDIYERRAENGFAGCSVFECYGAGQRISAQMAEHFALRSEGALTGEGAPAKGPIATDQAYEAFRALVRIHNALSQLKLLEDLPLNADQRAQYRAVLARLAPQEGWSREALAAFPPKEAERLAQEMAASLAGSEAGKALLAVYEARR